MDEAKISLLFIIKHDTTGMPIKVLNKFSGIFVYAKRTYTNHYKDYAWRNRIYPASKVEVSADDGSTWRSASIKDPPSKYTWVLWAAGLTPAASSRK